MFRSVAEFFVQLAESSGVNSKLTRATNFFVFPRPEVRRPFSLQNVLAEDSAWRLERIGSDPEVFHRMLAGDDLSVSFGMMICHFRPSFSEVEGKGVQYQKLYDDVLQEEIFYPVSMIQLCEPIVEKLQACLKEAGVSQLVINKFCDNFHSLGDAELPVKIVRSYMNQEQEELLMKVENRSKELVVREYNGEQAIFVKCSFEFSEVRFSFKDDANLPIAESPAAVSEFALCYSEADCGTLVYGDVKPGARFRMNALKFGEKFDLGDGCCVTPLQQTSAGLNDSVMTNPETPSSGKKLEEEFNRVTLG